MILEEGMTIKNYVLERRLGHGASGEVWMATDNIKSVAIKFMNEGLMNSPNAAKHRIRMEREINALRQLNHPNIPELYDYDLDYPRPYVVMRYIGGDSYEKLIKSGELLRIKLNRRLEIITEISRAIDAIHQAGLIHRDLKPANITGVDNPYLLDFSISLDEQDFGQTNLDIGTALYMPWDGNNDQAGDIYGFTLVAYEILFGKHAIFRREDALSRTLMAPVMAGERVRTNTWNLPSKIPPDELTEEMLGLDLVKLDAAFARGLGDREHRYAEAREFSRLLNEAKTTNLTGKAATQVMPADKHPSNLVPPVQEHDTLLEDSQVSSLPKSETSAKKELPGPKTAGFPIILPTDLKQGLPAPSNSENTILEAEPFTQRRRVIIPGLFVAAVVVVGLIVFGLMRGNGGGANNTATPTEIAASPTVVAIQPTEATQPDTALIVTEEPTVTDTVTSEPTLTSTATDTATNTATLEPTSTATDTATVAPTATSTATDKATSEPISISASTVTIAPTQIATSTETATTTIKPTSTFTDTVTTTSTYTSTSTTTNTITFTPTAVVIKASMTITPTETQVPTQTEATVASTQVSPSVVPSKTEEIATVVKTVTLTSNSAVSTTLPTPTTPVPEPTSHFFDNLGLGFPGFEAIQIRTPEDCTLSFNVEECTERSVWIDKFPVSIDQYTVCSNNDNPCSAVAADTTEGPVTEATWRQAYNFCKWRALRYFKGKGRLPTIDELNIATLIATSTGEWTATSPEDELIEYRIFPSDDHAKIWYGKNKSDVLPTDEKNNSRPTEFRCVFTQQESTVDGGN